MGSVSDSQSGLRKTQVLSSDAETVSLFWEKLHCQKRVTLTNNVAKVEDV